jgi:Domain of unknown function (DUF5753)
MARRRCHALPAFRDLDRRTGLNATQKMLSGDMWERVRLFRTYQTKVIPGLLQTAGYMTAVRRERGVEVDDVADALGERIGRQGYVFDDVVERDMYHAIAQVDVGDLDGAQLSRQDKFWVQGAPNGERWEIYTVLEGSPTFWGQNGGQSWEAAEAALDAGQADPAQTSQCCGGPGQPTGTAD